MRHDIRCPTELRTRRPQSPTTQLLPGNDCRHRQKALAGVARSRHSRFPRNEPKHPLLARRVFASHSSQAPLLGQSEPPTDSCSADSQDKAGDAAAPSSLLWTQDAPGGQSDFSYAEGSGTQTGVSETVPTSVEATRVASLPAPFASRSHLIVTGVSANAEVLINAFASGWGKGKPPALEGVHPEAELIVPESMPYGGGVYRGRERIAKWFVEDLWVLWDEFSSTPVDFIDGGDKIVVPVHVTGRTRNGTEVEADNVWIYGFERGKVRRARVYVDTAKIRDAVDA